jgi:hypothetical protein
MDFVVIALAWLFAAMVLAAILGPMIGTGSEVDNDDEHD